MFVGLALLSVTLVTTSSYAARAAGSAAVTRGVFRYTSTDFAAMHAAGFNAATDGGVQNNGDAEAAAAITGMVWVGAYNNLTCTQTMTDSAISALVQANVNAGHPGLRYEIGDEPTTNGCSAATTYAHMTQVVHGVDATAKTWVADDQFQIGNPVLQGVPMKGSVDILAFDVYPCQSGPCQYSAIDSAIQQIHAAQVTNWEFIIQDFSSGSWRWPAPAEIQAQFDHWRGQGASGYWVYAWDYQGQQVSAQPGNLAALQQINLQDPAVSPPHVMIVMMENHSYSAVIGNSQMPFINGLASANGLVSTNDLSHPSEPNYLGLTSGSIYDNPADLTPHVETYPGPNFTDELAAKGIGWHAYMEDMPVACDLTDQTGPGAYDVNHNPFMYYATVRNTPAQCNSVVPFTQLTADLSAGTAPPFLWVSPNSINDMENGTDAQGDNFIKTLVTQVQASSWWRAGSRIIVTWDEGSTSEQVLTLVVGSTHGTHADGGNEYGTLRGLEEAYGVGLLGHSADSNVGDILPLLTGGPAGPVSPISSSAQAYQRSAQDKVAYLHDGSLLIGYFDGTKGVVDQVTNPSTGPVTHPVQTISGDEVTLYTQAGSNSTDIWIQAGLELGGGGAPLEQIQHGTYDGSSFTWDSPTSIPGAVSPGRQDPSVTWTGKWLIASWWDDTNLSNSDNVFLNWTADKTGKTGWLPSAILLSNTGQNIVQVSIRHSAKLGATIAVYGGHSRVFTRTLLDSRADPSLANWTAESKVDPAYDDSEAGFGGPQIAIDENSGKIHVFRAVVNSGGPSWDGVTYWLGTPDAVPMVTGTVTWNPRLVIDAAATSSDPPDIAGAVDTSGKVYVFWTTAVTSGAIKYVTLVSPYTSASAEVTLASVGTQPRYPHVPAQAPLSRGYVPVVYQSGSSSLYSIVLDTTIAAAGGDTTPPTTPTGLSATATSAPQVNLSWNASTDNVGVSGYTVYRGGTALATVSGSTLAYVDKSVLGSSTYSYTVDAFDAAGNHSPQSAPVSVTTPDTTPPSVPAGVSAVAVSVSEIDVSWSASNDNVGVTGYTVYRNGTLLATVGAAVTSWHDTTVSPSTTYSYTIDAFDAAGNHSAQSPPAAATTPAVPDTTPPSVPAGVAAKVGPVGEVDVSWGASIDNVGVTGYTVYRDGVALGTVSGATLAYADKSVLGSTTYGYTVDAFDAAGNHSAQSAPTAAVTTPDWTPPTTPTGLTARVISGGEIDLSWTASADNVAVTGYTVYRNGVAIATTTAGTQAYADTGVGQGFTYTYKVDAFDAAGNHSSQSAPVSATTPDDLPPTVPGNLTAAAASPTSVVVSWSASTDNVAVAGYDVIRDGIQLVTLGPGAFTYGDIVAAGSTHAYTVDAFDAAGNHSGSPQAISVTTPTADTTPPTVPTGLTATANGSTQVGLGWNAATDNVAVTGYTIYRNGTLLATVGGSVLAYSDTTVGLATDYTYTVDAFDAAGNHSAQSAPAPVHVPGKPKFVQASVVTTGSRVTRMTMTFGPVAKGDLLVGWFAQYDSTGQVMVSDNVNGAWTRSASTTWRGSPTAPGDIALYYFANSVAATGGLTITISATKATYLQASASEYSGVAAVNPLNQVVVAKGTSTSADSGLTAAVPSGELVFGAMTATNGAGTLTAGTSQGAAYVKRGQSSGGTQGEEDIVVGAAGQQHAGFTFTKSVPWFTVCAVFKPA